MRFVNAEKLRLLAISAMMALTALERFKASASPDCR
jgi:hypothetical protein